MNNVKNILDTLSSSIEGHNLLDVKFFAGKNREVTQEKFCEEANKSLTQFHLGQVEPKKSIDGHLKVVSINDFLK